MFSGSWKPHSKVLPCSVCWLKFICTPEFKIENLFSSYYVKLNRKRAELCRFFPVV